MEGRRARASQQLNTILFQSQVTRRCVLLAMVIH
jgi:hypothetical protein